MGGGDVANEGVDSNNDVGEEVMVNIRCSNGSKFSVQANLNSTVELFKSIVAEKCEIPSQQQRLIYKGRILKGDQTLRSYGLEDDHTVHLVRRFARAAPAESAATTDAGIRSTNSISTTDSGPNEGGPRGRSSFGSSLFPGLDLNGLGSDGGLFGAMLPGMEQMQQQLTQNPNLFRDILDMPLAQNLMNNPETIHNLIMNNPQMREIMDRNPELAHILNDPATLRQTMEAVRNPEIRREMRRNTDRAMSNIESSPEGFNMLRRMYENVQEPFLNARTVTADNGSDLGSNPFAALLGGLAGGSGRENSTNSATPAPRTMTDSPGPNANPLPNPWASASTAGIQANSDAQSSPTDVGPGGFGGLGLPDLERMMDSMPDLTSFNQLIENPTVSEMMRNLLSNPQYMNQILGFNPQLQSMLDSNPQLRDMMQNPELIRQLTSPETMQQLLNFHQAFSSQLGRQTSQEPCQHAGGTAGTTDNTGLDMLMSMFRGLGVGGGITTPNRSQAGTIDNAGLDRLTNMFGGLGVGGGITTPNRSQAGTTDNAGLDRLMNMFGELGVGGGITTPNRSQVPPEELYATQLSQLREMGFYDTQENIRALIATAGNVHATVERLLQSPGQ